MTDASLIIPVTAANEVSFYSATVALRTLRATAPTIETLVFLNNTPTGWMREGIITQCRLLGIRLIDWSEPFSMSRIFNAGTRMTERRYIAWAGQDSIFYPGWLEAMTDAFSLHPDYAIFWPWSFDWRDFGVSFRSSTTPAEGILEGPTPAGAVVMMRRVENYWWDEHFTRWELDADMHYEMKARGWKGACVLNARVDHLVETIDRSIDYIAAYGQSREVVNAEATAYLRQKWHL